MLFADGARPAGDHHRAESATATPRERWPPALDSSGNQRYRDLILPQVSAPVAVVTSSVVTPDSEPPSNTAS